MGDEKKQGLGCGGGNGGIAGMNAQAFLDQGLPRIALARLKGVGLAPRVLVVTATFDTTDVQVLPSKSFSDKVAQDYIVDRMIVRVTEDTPTANALDAQSRFFNQYMDGIEATLDVQGAPRFTIADDFVPLSILADVIASGGPSFPQGWGLTYQQQIIMSFSSRFQLPFAPTTVKLGFRMWGPTGEEFEMMETRTAIEQLQKCGMDIPSCYQMYCK